MTRQFAYLNISRRIPKLTHTHNGHLVAEVIHIRVQERMNQKYKTLGTLPKTFKVYFEGKKEPALLPRDRALTWKELARWIEHLLVFKHPDVVEGQYQNRLLWENWERSLGERPKRSDLYEWQTDQAVLEDLRPRYIHICHKLAKAIGRPSAEDFGELYPNEYDDIGYSDRARRAIKELKALLGKELFLEGN